ncbi:MAG: hypothetical protein K9J27_01355 [Bacteroidales bacterium]|nr:hypothetical protein [Bacteroidales bacterium]MCF8332620.1 hypothetical protein [Bacteroidales bacterium]
MHREIDKLIEKYFESNTSLEEEKALKRFFNQEEVPPHLEKYQKYFGMIDQERRQIAGEIDFSTFSASARSQKYRGIRNWSIAATIVLLLGIGLMLDQQYTSPDEAEVIKAFEQTKIALSYAGNHFNKGMAEAQEMSHFPKAMEKFNEINYYQKSLNEMKELKTFSNGYQKMTMFKNFTNYQPTKK